jgi:hypothetical protein
MTGHAMVVAEQNIFLLGVPEGSQNMQLFMLKNRTFLLAIFSLFFSF